MAMRDYDRDRDMRGMSGTNGLYGRDQQRWDDDWSLGDFQRSERGGWSTRPRYGYGESDRGTFGGGYQGGGDFDRGFDRGRFETSSRDFEGMRGRGFGGGYGQSYSQGSYGQGSYGQGSYGQGRYGQSNYGSYDPYSRRDREMRGGEEPGLWDRFKGEMREGWERVRGGDPERNELYGRGYDERSFGRDRNEGFWDETKREMREGWNKVKETFRGRGPKGYARSDERIREDICDRLSWHHDVDATNIEVMVKDGEVELTGTVEERRQKRLAEDIVEDILGVKDVTNRIRVSQKTQQLGTSTTLRENGGTTTTPNNQVGQQNARTTSR
jgi:hypothetical protein